MGRVEVDILVVPYSTQHITGRGPGRPAKTRGPPQGQGGRRRRRRNSTPQFMGRGPSRPVTTRRPPHGPGRAAHIKPTSHGARPGPAHQKIVKTLGLAQPGPSIFFQKSRPGPAQPIKFQPQNSRPGPARPMGNFQIGPARPSPHFWPMTCSYIKQ